MFSSRFCCCLALAILLGITESSLIAAAPAPPVALQGVVTAALNDRGEISIQPQGTKAASDVVKITTDMNTVVSFGKQRAKPVELNVGTWIKPTIANGVATEIVAGQIVQQEGDKLVLFKDLPEAFFLSATGFDVRGYPAQTGPLQLMYRLTGNGAYLRPGIKDKPSGGYVMYWPTSIRAKFYDGKSRPQPDDQGRLFWPGELTEVRIWFNDPLVPEKVGASPAEPNTK